MSFPPIQLSQIFARFLLLTLFALSTTLVHAEKVYKLRLAETWGPNFPIFGDASKNMAAMADKMSNGRLSGEFCLRQ